MKSSNEENVITLDHIGADVMKVMQSGIEFTIQPNTPHHSYVVDTAILLMALRGGSVDEQLHDGGMILTDNLQQWIREHVIPEKIQNLTQEERVVEKTDGKKSPNRPSIEEAMDEIMEDSDDEGNSLSTNKVSHLQKNNIKFIINSNNFDNFNYSVKNGKKEKIIGKYLDKSFGRGGTNIETLHEFDKITNMTEVESMIFALLVEIKISMEVLKDMVE